MRSPKSRPGTDCRMPGIGWIGDFEGFQHDFFVKDVMLLNIIIGWFLVSETRADCRQGTTDLPTSSSRETTTAMIVDSLALRLCLHPLSSVTQTGRPSDRHGALRPACGRSSFRWGACCSPFPKYAVWGFPLRRPVAPGSTLP